MKEIIVKNKDYEVVFSLNNGYVDYCKIYSISGDLMGQIKYFEDPSIKIANLEANLVESERGIEKFKAMYFNKCKDYEHLMEQLGDKSADLHQIYSHLGVEAFGEDIHEQAMKELTRLLEK